MERALITATIALPPSRIMKPSQDLRSGGGGQTASSESADAQTQAAVHELLAILPADVLEEIRNGEIDVGDPAFLNGLMDHASRQSVADPRNGRRILGKIIKLRKLIHRTLRDSDPEIVATSTVQYEDVRTGRNAPCRCGSGRKFKQCCMRKP
jgi:hypothetical protein